MKNDLITIAESYFSAWSNKDLGKMEQMFSSDCSLRDWMIYKKGLDKVLEANDAIFSSVESIKAVPIKIYQDQNTVIAELKITVVEKGIIQEILVTDVIEFDENKKIGAIRAYKGN